MVLEIQLPECSKGVGHVIPNPDSPNVIAGVGIQPFPLFPDDRGCFLEVGRLGKELLAGYTEGTTQVSAALNYPGTIKAFHFHRRQTDYWVAATGMLQVALVDLRPESKTFGSRNTFYVGSMRPWRILIPPGVGHGYKVIGREPSLLVYLTDRFYDPEDEGRVAYDDPKINYDWKTQHR